MNSENDRYWIRLIISNSKGKVRSIRRYVSYSQECELLTRLNEKDDRGYTLLDIKIDE